MTEISLCAGLAAMLGGLVGSVVGVCLARRCGETRRKRRTDRLDGLATAMSSRFEAMGKLADETARQQVRASAKLAALTIRLDALARLIRDIAFGIVCNVKTGEPDQSGSGDGAAAP